MGLVVKSPNAEADLRWRPLGKCPLVVAGGLKRVRRVQDVGWHGTPEGDPAPVEAFHDPILAVGEHLVMGWNQRAPNDDSGSPSLAGLYVLEDGTIGVPGDEPGAVRRGSRPVYDLAAR